MIHTKNKLAGLMLSTVLATAGINAGAQAADLRAAGIETKTDHGLDAERHDDERAEPDPDQHDCPGAPPGIEERARQGTGETEGERRRERQQQPPACASSGRAHRRHVIRQSAHES